MYSDQKIQRRMEKKNREEEITTCLIIEITKIVTRPRKNVSTQSSITIGFPSLRQPINAQLSLRVEM